MCQGERVPIPSPECIRHKARSRSRAVSLRADGATAASRAKDDEAVVFDFCSVLHQQHFVADALFARAVSILEQGVVDLGVSGYYTLVFMVLNVAEIPLPAGVASPW